jgi:hypothetical protein
MSRMARSAERLIAGAAEVPGDLNDRLLWAHVASPKTSPRTSPQTHEFRWHLRSPNTGLPTQKTATGLCKAVYTGPIPVVASE